MFRSGFCARGSNVELIELEKARIVGDDLRQAVAEYGVAVLTRGGHSVMRSDQESEFARMEAITMRPIGVVRSVLKDRADAPRQADEDAPPARIEIRPEFAPAMLRLERGTPLMILTWLHLADRDVLQVHSRGDLTLPLCGVFATRSPGRPNPIGLHRTTVVAVEENVIVVEALEAIDGTPVLDIKPVLGDIEGR